MVCGFIDFIAGDDIATLQSDDATFFSKGLAAGMIVLNFAPGGGIVTKTAKFVIKGPEWANSAGRVVPRSTLDDAIRRSSGISPELAEGISKTPARDVLAKKFPALRNSIDEFRRLTAENRRPQYGLARFTEHLETIADASKTDAGLIRQGDSKESFERSKGLDSTRPALSPTSFRRAFWSNAATTSM